MKTLIAALLLSITAHADCFDTAYVKTKANQEAMAGAFVYPFYTFSNAACWQSSAVPRNAVYVEEASYDGGAWQTVNVASFPNTTSSNYSANYLRCSSLSGVRIRVTLTLTSPGFSQTNWAIIEMAH